MQCQFVLPKLDSGGYYNCQGEQGHTGGHYKHGTKPVEKDQKYWYEHTHCGECGRPFEGEA